MDFNGVLGIILPIIYIIVGIALVWFVVELALTIRTARSTVDNVSKQIEPTIDHVNQITASIEPVVQKVDPLMDRVNLTVDAANLEIMRVDSILEDVQQVTDTVTKTLDTVDNVTSLPLDAVNNVTSKIRKAFKKPQASAQSVALGEQKAAEAAAAPKPAKTKPDTPLNRDIEAAAEGAKDLQKDLDDLKSDIAEAASSYVIADEPVQG